MTERTAIVTGGSRGIGRAVVRRLAADGHRVVAVGRSEEALAETAAEVDGVVETEVLDVTDSDGVQALVADLDVDVLVNNAGVASAAPVHRTTVDDWDRALAVNLTAPFVWTRAVLPGMRSRDRGRIVTVGSTASHTGSPYIAAYAASKHGVLGLMRVVAAEVAGTGVTANTVCPTYVDTAMTDASVSRIAEATGREPDDARSSLAGHSPLGRLLDPAEVAAAVAYLVSDEAAAVNGQSIVLDGGGIQR